VSVLINVIILDFTEFCGMDEVMDNLHCNYNYWKKLEDRGIMRLAELEDETNSDLDFSSFSS